MANVKDLIGQRFGKLVVLSRAENDKTKHTRWLCQCDCGNTKIVHGCSLKRGLTQSCGCLQKEIFGENARKIHTTHGKTNTRLFNIWGRMKDRCYNEKHLHYKNYGGRGIIVCNEWKNDFQTFYDWAINNGYFKNLTLDRIDNNGNYEPNNCHWVTSKQQSRNKRNNHLITYKDKTYCIAEWADIFNVSYDILYQKLYARQFCLEKVIEDFDDFKQDIEKIMEE